MVQLLKIQIFFFISLMIANVVSGAKIRFQYGNEKNNYVEFDIDQGSMDKGEYTTKDKSKIFYNHEKDEKVIFLVGDQKETHNIFSTAKIAPNGESIALPFEMYVSALRNARICVVVVTFNYEIWKSALNLIPQIVEQHRPKSAIPMQDYMRIIGIGQCAKTYKLHQQDIKPSDDEFLQNLALNKGPLSIFKKVPETDEIQVDPTDEKGFMIYDLVAKTTKTTFLPLTSDGALTEFIEKIPIEEISFFVVEMAEFLKVMENCALKAKYDLHAYHYRIQTKRVLYLAGGFNLDERDSFFVSSLLGACYKRTSKTLHAQGDGIFFTGYRYRRDSKTVTECKPDDNKNLLAIRRILRGKGDDHKFDDVRLVTIYDPKHHGTEKFVTLPITTVHGVYEPSGVGLKYRYERDAGKKDIYLVIINEKDLGESNKITENIKTLFAKYAETAIAARKANKNSLKELAVLLVVCKNIESNPRLLAAVIEKHKGNATARHHEYVKVIGYGVFNGNLWNSDPRYKISATQDLAFPPFLNHSSAENNISEKSFIIWKFGKSNLSEKGQKLTFTLENGEYLPSTEGNLPSTSLFCAPNHNFIIKIFLLTTDHPKELRDHRNRSGVFDRLLQEEPNPKTENYPGNSNESVLYLVECSKIDASDHHIIEEMIEKHRGSHPRWKIWIIPSDSDFGKLFQYKNCWRFRYTPKIVKPKSNEPTAKSVPETIDLTGDDPQTNYGTSYKHTESIPKRKIIDLTDDDPQTNDAIYKHTKSTQEPGIIDLTDDDPEDSNSVIRTAENIQELELRKALSEIRTPRTYLSDTPIDIFIKIANKRPGQHMLSTLNAQNKRQYGVMKIEDKDKNDLQILFLGDVGKIGHYICINYVAKEKTLYVYDPLDSLTSLHSYDEVVRLRYPSLQNIVYPHPRTKQPDQFSCGVFSLAYATTIILGRDPANYNLRLGPETSADRTTYCRQHLAKIIENGEITLFPSN